MPLIYTPTPPFFSNIAPSTLHNNYLFLALSLSGLQLFVPMSSLFAWTFPGLSSVPRMWQMGMAVCFTVHPNDSTAGRNQSHLPEVSREGPSMRTRTKHLAQTACLLANEISQEAEAVPEARAPCPCSHDRSRECQDLIRGSAPGIGGWYRNSIAEPGRRVL